MPVRNGAGYYAGMVYLDTALASGDVDVTGSIGLYVEVGGFVKVMLYDGTVNEFKAGDVSYHPGLFVTVYQTVARGAAATGIHALK